MPGTLMGTQETEINTKLFSSDSQRGPWLQKRLRTADLDSHLEGVGWLPWWLSGKESACQYRRHRFDPWVGKIPWWRKWQPTPVFLPGESHGQRSLEGYHPWGCKRVVHDLAIKTKTSDILFIFVFPCLCHSALSAELSDALVCLYQSWRMLSHAALLRLSSQQRGRIW